MEALAASIRGRDGRGPQTTLERLVPAALDRRRPGDLTTDLESGRLTREELRAVLPPVVFAAAADGDPVAARIVDDVADEVVAWAVAMIRRLHLTRRDVPVVLSGGIIRTAYRPFHERIASRDPGRRTGRPDPAARRPAGRRRRAPRPRPARSPPGGAHRGRGAAPGSPDVRAARRRPGGECLAERLVVDEASRAEPDREREEGRPVDPLELGQRVRVGAADVLDLDERLAREDVPDGRPAGGSAERSPAAQRSRPASERRVDRRRRGALGRCQVDVARRQGEAVRLAHGRAADDPRRRGRGRGPSGR